MRTSSSSTRAPARFHGERRPGHERTQFFICTVKTSWLDGRHVVFGKVTSGMDVVRAIEALDGTPPKKTIEIVDAGELPMGEPVNEVIEDTL